MCHDLSGACGDRPEVSTEILNDLLVSRPSERRNVEAWIFNRVELKHRAIRRYSVPRQ
jgi:hypothetical protein